MYSLWVSSSVSTSTGSILIERTSTGSSVTPLTMIFRAGLHYGSWSRTMEEGLFRRFEFMVRLPWFHFFKKTGFESLGSHTRCKLNVDQEESPCAKKWMCWCFLNVCPKRTFSCLFLGFIYLRFLLSVSKMWLAKLYTTIFTKKNCDLICTCDMYFVLYIKHEFHWRWEKSPHQHTNF